MVAAQFHPEFTSRPNHPNPLFLGFVDAAIKYQKNSNSKSEKLDTKQTSSKSNNY